jgi:hypothetical protein
MNSSNNPIQLTLIHPDDTIETNGLLDELFDFRNIDYISPVTDTNDEKDEMIYLEKERLNDLVLEPTEILNPDFKYKIGDGKMEYIKDNLNRVMFTNAWKAITLTNNWDFIAQEMDGFVLSKDPRIYDITDKMEELGYKGHSGTSFGLTMRSMQYLVMYGEEEFKKMF